MTRSVRVTRTKTDDKENREEENEQEGVEEVQEQREESFKCGEPWWGDQKGAGLG